MGFVPARVVTSSGEISEIVRGDDYTGDIGRAFEWTLPESRYGDLTGAGVLFQEKGLGCVRESVIGPIAGEIVDGGLETQRALVELAAAVNTAGRGEYRWEVQIRTAAERTFTPLRGLTHVIEDLITS